MSTFYAIISSFWFEVLIRLILGFLLAGFIGAERESVNKPAGFKTHSLIGVSAVLIMLCGEYLSNNYSVDASRIPAQLLSGIGFIGAGTILRDGFNVKGLTTAAGLLAVTCIGLSIGAGFYLGGIFTTLIVYIVLSYSYKISDKLDHFKILELQITIAQNSNEVISEIGNIFSDFNIDIKHIKRPKKDELEGQTETINIVGQHSKKDFNKNELMKAISSLENVTEIMEE